MGKLVYFHANGTVREIRLDRERITIGRRPDNDVCLPQPPVSGAHAAIVTILADSFLEDLGSTNGTLVNGKAIAKYFLRDRDEIDIGREILVYLVDESAMPDVPPRLPDRSPHAAGIGGDAAVTDAGAHAGSDGLPGGKRRSDPPVSPGAVDEDAVPAGSPDPGGMAAPAASAAADGGETPATVAPAEPVPVIRVLSGARAGHVVPLAGSETLVGRAGVQVAALRRDADEIRVVPIEGASRPSVNGTPIAPEGQRLVPGDVLEIAGAQVELLPAGQRGA